MNTDAAFPGFMQSSSSESFSAPQTYPELLARYGSHIEKLLLRANHYTANYEDLRSYVWVKLLEAQLLERFQEHMDRQIPRVLKTDEVCDFLGVSRQEWVEALVASHSIPGQTWMPTPVNLAEFKIQGIPWYEASNAMFSFADVLSLTYGEEIKGVKPWTFDRWGCEILDGEIISDSRPEGHLKYVPIYPTANQFKHYLNRAVLNHWANFCRTLKRRHKERPQNPQGDEGHMTSWEDTLVELKQPSMDVKIAVSEARAIVCTALQKGFDDMNVSSSGDAVGKIFALLEQGASLQQALKQCGFPNKLRKSVIRSIRSRTDSPGSELSEELE